MMGRLFFDLLVVLAIGKEAHHLLIANQLEPSLAILALVGVPFFVGATKGADRTIVIDPGANLIRLLVSLLSLIIFLLLDRISLAPGLGPVVLIMTMPGYIFGRVLGGLGFKWFVSVGLLIALYMAYLFLARYLGFYPER